MTTQPVHVEVERSQGKVLAHGQVPEDLAYFDGHFPGYPVVPGFVLLDWALRIAECELGRSVVPSALEALKFHRVLEPGDAFSLELELRDDRVAFALRSHDVRIASGRARHETPPSLHAPATNPPQPDASLPLRVPYAGVMRLVTRVVAQREGSTLCEANLALSSPLCESGEAPGWLAVELLAQGMAAAGGVEVENSRARRGLLASARRIELRTSGFRVGERLWVHARHLRGEKGRVLFECAVGAGRLPEDVSDAHAHALALGSLAAVVSPLA